MIPPAAQKLTRAEQLQAPKRLARLAWNTLTIRVTSREPAKCETPFSTSGERIHLLTSNIYQHMSVLDGFTPHLKHSIHSKAIESIPGAMKRTPRAALTQMGDVDRLYASRRLRQYVVSVGVRLYFSLPLDPYPLMNNPG